MFGLGKKKDDEGKKEDDKEKGDDAKEEGGAAGGDAAGGDAAAAEEENNDGKVCTMKRGDYMIHVMVEQAKNLKMPSDKTVDPIVEIKILNEKKFTTAQEKINNVGIAIWNEHLFFEPKNQEVEDLERARIEIKLMDKGFFKDALIGYYEFDLSYIYKMKNHGLFHKWIIMSNPEDEDFGAITGQLKLSITIAGEGDDVGGIDDDPNPEKEEVIQPPQVKPVFYQVRFRFFSAQNIVPMDTKTLGIGQNKTDAYIRLDYRTSKLKTKIVICPENGQCNWYQEMLVPAQIPLIGGRLVFKVYDDDLSGDEIVGAIYYDLKDIIPDANGKPGKLNGRFDWKNIYGAPMDMHGKWVDKMNENPEVASFWKGRVLVQCIAEQSEKPVLLVKDLDQDVIESAIDCYEKRTYQVRCFFYGALCTPKQGEDYGVSLRIADKEWKQEKATKVLGRYCRYNTIITEDDKDKNKDNALQKFEAPYMSIDDIGTVYFYLWKKLKLKGWQRICYWKGSIQQFKEPNAKLLWLEMNPDLAIGEVKKAYKAGVLGVKFAIHDETSNGEIEWKKYTAWSGKIARRPPIIKIRVFVWQCRDLPAADENGSSDPFMRISDCDRNHDTEVIWDNLNPLFYQGLEVAYEANSAEEVPPVIIECYDKDEALIGDGEEEFISRAVLDLNKISYSTGNEVPRPEWHNMYFKTGGAVSGQCLLSFAKVRDDFTFDRTLPNLHLENEVKMKEHVVSMNILGLRGLQSPGVLPVKKAFLSFNLKSMVPPALGTNLHNIKTEPKMAGSDPTLNTLLEFNAPLPIDELFCPRLSCVVFDNIAMGLSQPQIGTFVIPVGDLMHALAKERIEETDALEYVVTEVRKIARGEMLAASFRKRISMKMEQEEARIKLELEEIRVKEALKNSLKKKMVVATSINADDGAIMETGNVTEKLLPDDADDEVKLSERLNEIQMNVEDPQRRMTLEAQQKIANALRMKIDNSLPSEQKVRLNSIHSQRALSGGDEMNHYDPHLKEELLAQHKAQVERAERDAEEERAKAEMKYHTSANIVMPEYEYDEEMLVDREVNKPPAALFIGCGWDEDKDTKRKHYRRYYNKPLEKVEEILPVSSPFNQYDLKRGQSRGAKVSAFKSLFGSVKHDASGEADTTQITGRFKAVVEVEGRQDKKDYLEKKADLIERLITSLKMLAKNRKIEDFDLDLEILETIEGRREMRDRLEPLGVNHLKIVKKLADIESDVILKRMLLRKTKCVVRIYMISGADLASRDMGGFSDPYLILKLGRQVINDRKNYVLDEPNPFFCKKFDFETTFPGCPMLKIDAMDYDLLFSDDLIGTTNVDLEDRYFLPEWRALQEVPIEFRQIYIPTSNVSQGVLKMWIEINPTKVKPGLEKKEYDITMKPPQDFQMRLCIFGTEDLVIEDDGTCLDPFFRCFFDSKRDALETDTHYRLQTGKASYNYRLNYKVSMPRKDYRFTIQAFDRDFFKSNEIIGSHIIDLRQIFEDADLTKRPIRLTKSYYEKYMLSEEDKNDKKGFRFSEDGDSFWVPLIGKSDSGVLENHGEVECRIDITTMDYANDNKVGSAREDPNIEPFLPPPVGRLTFSLNPCAMYKQLVGPAARAKIQKYCMIMICSICCVAILYYLVPIIMGNLLSSWIMHGF